LFIVRYWHAGANHPTAIHRPCAAVRMTQAIVDAAGPRGTTISSRRGRHASLREQKLIGSLIANDPPFALKFRRHGLGRRRCGRRGDRGGEHQSQRQMIFPSPR